MMEVPTIFEIKVNLVEVPAQSMLEEKSTVNH